MVKKRKKKAALPVHYIVKISDYSSDYSRSLGIEEDEPYWDCLSINLSGSLEITDSKKVSQGAAVEVIIQSDRSEVPNSFKPLCVSSISLKDGLLTCIALLPPSDVQYILTLLSTGKAEVVDLLGEELYRNQARLSSFRVTTNFQWEEWQEEATVAT